MNILQAEDCVNGREGIATATINDEVIELMELANININIEKEKKEFKAMGTRNTQNKTTGWKGTGKMNVRYISTRWAELMLNYIKNGKDTYFTIVVTNEDPGTSLGKQTIQILGCNIDSLDIAKLDVDSEILDQDVDFTFNDINILDSFNEMISESRNTYGG